MNSWFDVVACWTPSLFTKEAIAELAKRLGWGLGYDVVEREMLYYDTMYAFLTHIPEEVVAGGGSVVNRVYVSKGPRFSFDLDTTALKPFSAKAQLIAPLLELNQVLEEKGMVKVVELGGFELRLGEVVVDVEKDWFPDVLSLKRVMPSLTFGTPLPTYLRSRYGLDPGKPPLSQAIVELRDRLGYLPSVEEVRIQVGISSKGFGGSWKLERISSLLEPIAKPEKSVEAPVSSIEYSIATKLSSLSRPYAPELLPDMVRDLCDLRMLSQGFEEEELKKFVNKPMVEKALENVDRVEVDGREMFNRSWHFALVRRIVEWSALCAQVRRSLKKLLSDLLIKS